MWSAGFSPRLSRPVTPVLTTSGHTGLSILNITESSTRLFPWGAAVSWFGGTADELNKDNVKVGNADYSGFAVMPAAKAFWFRKPHVAMYSKLAAGVTLLDDYDEEADSHSFDPYWAAQVTLAGVQFGGERFRGFVEAGAGMQGLVLAGLSVSF